MKNFIFKTSTTMKPHNSRKWWIDSGIVREKKITAGTLIEALELYREAVQDEHYISISDNALKTKEPMYIDTIEGESKQVGYVITGKTEFYNDEGHSSAQYIDLWVTVLTVVNTDFNN